MKLAVRDCAELLKSGLFLRDPLPVYEEAGILVSSSIYNCLIWRSIWAIVEFIRPIEVIAAVLGPIEDRPKALAPNMDELGRPRELGYALSIPPGVLRFM